MARPIDLSAYMLVCICKENLLTVSASCRRGNHSMTMVRSDSHLAVMLPGHLCPSDAVAVAAAGIITSSSHLAQFFSSWCDYSDLLVQLPQLEQTFRHMQRRNRTNKTTCNETCSSSDMISVYQFGANLSLGWLTVMQSSGLEIQLELFDSVLRRRIVDDDVMTIKTVQIALNWQVLSMQYNRYKCSSHSIRILSARGFWTALHKLKLLIPTIVCEQQCGDLNKLRESADQRSSLSECHIDRLW